MVRVVYLVTLGRMNDEGTFSRSHLYSIYVLANREKEQTRRVPPTPSSDARPVQRLHPLGKLKPPLIPPPAFPLPHPHPHIPARRMDTARDPVPIHLWKNPLPPSPPPIHRLHLEPHHDHGHRARDLGRGEEPARAQRLAAAPGAVGSRVDFCRLGGFRGVWGGGGRGGVVFEEAAGVVGGAVGAPDGVGVDEGAGDHEDGVLFQ